MKEKLIGGLIDGREKRYMLKCHYLGDSGTDFSIVYDGHCLLDAVNHALEQVNYDPIVFDTIIVEEKIAVENIVVENIIEDSK